MSDALRVLAVSGSLRKGSFNTALLNAAIGIAKAEGLSLEFDIANIADIPLYNEDLRGEGLPPAVQTFRDQIERAQGVLFVTPEYNHSVPGVLKNAIDWASRPGANGKPHPFAGKPFAMMGASGGMSGTMRAQYHLRQIAVFLDMHALNRPEVFVRNAKSVFDANLSLTDEPTKKVVTDLLRAFATWTKRFAQAQV